ncbi:MAG: universal stress protein [Kiloniellales bacterium]|nr:universal stress protein [Kiloniellales bacterium]
MTWAKVLAYIDGEKGSEAVVGAALRLGQAFAARVELLHIELSEEQTIPIVAEGMTAGAVGQMLESLSEQRQTRAEAAEALFKSLCLDAGLETCAPDDPPEPGRFRVAFRRVSGREADELSRRGRLADLVLVRGPVAEAGFSQAVETAMFQTGRPLLMIPENLPERLGASIAIAWDGSLGAARAAGAALPLLGRAETVTILTADMEKVGAKPSALADYLAEHGIAARTWAFLPDGGALGERLLDEAVAAGADMLAMGAYGHSRLREMVLGGVTQSVTAKAEIPVFMTH